jgi:hypothetical protein
MQDTQRTEAIAFQTTREEAATNLVIKIAIKFVDLWALWVGNLLDWNSKARRLDNSADGDGFGVNFFEN